MSTGNKIPGRILKGDKIKLDPERARPYALMYGAGIQDKTWTVQAVDKVGGSPRLYVEGQPGLIWARDAKLCYGEQSPQRREALGL